MGKFIDNKFPEYNAKFYNLHKLDSGHLAQRCSINLAIEWNPDSLFQTE